MAIERVVYSGGARGADLAWAEVATRHGWRAVHYSFPGHQTEAPPETLVRLSDQELRRANPALAITAPRLGRSWPPKHAYVRKLLQRNYYQVMRRAPVYAVATLQDETRVMGGTGWAVAMATWRNEHIPSMVEPVYVFDQTRNAWFGWNGTRFVQLDGVPPRPSGSFTGIGTRELTAAGREQIKRVFERE